MHIRRAMLLLSLVILCSTMATAATSRRLRQTDCTLAGPELFSPEDGEDGVTSPVTFSWSDSDGAEGYGLHIYVDGDLFEELTTDQTSMDVELPSGEIDWYVDAHGEDCDPGYSEDFEFTIEPAVSCPTDPPQLLGPDDGSTLSSPVDFSWTDSGASSYHLFVYLDGDLFNDFIVSDTELELDLPPGDYSWQVEAQSDGCDPLDSDSASFTVPEPCPTDGPQRFSPDDDSSVTSPVHFEWSEVDGSNLYRLIIYPAGGSDPYDVEETGDTSIDVTVDPGDYNWVVEANFDSCDALDSDTGSFTVEPAESCPDEGPVLLDPDDDSEFSSGPITFDWAPVDGAIGYELYVAPPDGSPTLVEETGDTSVTTEDIPEGTNDWFVLAIFDGCDPTQSDSRTYTIDPSSCDHDTPSGFAPPDGTTNAISPVTFAWTPVDDAISYIVYISVHGADFEQLGDETSDTQLTADVPSGDIEWIVQPFFSDCAGDASEPNEVTVAPAVPPCTDPGQPTTYTYGACSSDTEYFVFWTPVSSSNTYEIQESTSPDFSAASTLTLNEISTFFKHTVNVQTNYYYRVRGINSCTQTPGPFSSVVSIVIDPLNLATDDSFKQVTSLGHQEPITQTLFIPGSSAGSRKDPPATEAEGRRQHPISRGPGAGMFSATTDQPWLTVTPSSGSVPPEGTTVTLTSDPTSLPVGTSTATVQLSSGTATSTSVPVSVSLVTPVVLGDASAPPPDALILPNVLHSDAAASPVSTNVEISNLSTRTMKVQLNFSPSDPSGSASAQQAVIQIEAGRTAALTDILKNWFGIASTELASGSVQVRALDSAGGSLPAGAPSIVTSGVTFVGGSATTGGFINAIPYSRFVGKARSASAPATLFLQGLSQNSSTISSIGLLEASGQPAVADVAVFGQSGDKIDEFAVSMEAGQQGEVSLASRGISTTAARAEVNVTSATGKISAYARVTDVASGDSETIPATGLADVSPGYVILGASQKIDSTGTRKTDLLLFNGGTTATTAVLHFSPDGNPSAISRATIDLAPGETRAVTAAVNSLFGLGNVEGSLAISSLGSVTANGRTYVAASGGTVGDLASALPASAAIALRDRPLQILHLEQSSRFASALAIAEVIGNAAAVEITAVVPGALSAPVLTLQLRPFEYHRIDTILQQMGIATAYNARLSIRVTEGSGKVLAQGILTNQASHDLTIVPAE